MTKKSRTKKSMRKKSMRLRHITMVDYRATLPGISVSRDVPVTSIKLIIRSKVAGNLCIPGTGDYGDLCGVLQHPQPWRMI